MTMIGFITWNSSLVPLIESLCSLITCGFEFSVLRSLLLFTSFAFLFRKKKYDKEQKQLVQILYRPSASIDVAFITQKERVW